VPTTIDDLHALLKELSERRGTGTDDDRSARRGETKAPTDDFGAGATKRIKEQREYIQELSEEYVNLDKNVDKLTESLTYDLKESMIELNEEYAQQKIAILEEIESNDERIAQIEKLIETKENGVAMAGAAKKALREEAAALKDSTGALNENIKALEKRKNAEKGQVKADTDVAKQVSEMGKKWTGATMKAGSFGDQMMQLRKRMKAAGGSTKGLMKGMKDMALSLPLVLAQKLVTATFDLAKAQDKAISAFKKATGAGKQYNLEITKLQRSTQAAGVTAADAGKTFGTLFESFSAFTQLSEKERATLGETSALLGKLGVDAASSGKIMDQMTRSLGMSAEGTNDILLRLAGNAKSLGVSMKKMAADFAGAFKELAKYGDNAIDVFEGLSKQAKATGISVGNLLGLAKKFDTFDSAATSVGKLNAILGGPYLNSIDMLNATESERIDLLRQTVDASGLQFDAMNRFEKQAIAAAMGMSVEDASRIMKMSTAEMRLQSLQQEELAELAADSQEIMEKLKNAFRTLLVDMRPLIETVIIPVLDFFGGIAKFFGEAEGAMGRFIKIGLLAAAVAALIAAPFTGGTSLAMYAAIAGVGVGGIAALGGGAVNKAASRKVKGYAGGTNTGQTVGDYFSSKPIKMNELGPEGIIGDANAFVPDNTIIQSHAELRKEGQRKDDSNKLLRAILNKLGDQKVSVNVGGHEFEDFAVKTFDAGASSQNVGNPYRRG